MTDEFEYTISNELNIYKDLIRKFLQWITRGRKSLELIQRNNDYDAIIAYQPSLYFLEKLKELCRKKGKKLIVDITEWYDNDELRLLDRPIQHYNMTTALKSVKNKIIISTSLDNYYKGTNNVVIPATCDYEEKKWSKKSAFKFPDFDGITLIYAGTPTLKDKLSIVVNAISRLIKKGKQFRFFVFGVTKEQYLTQNPSELPEQINFMGRISQDDIPGYYHQSDFMVFLRDRTRKNMMGFPTKFAEAITSGVPIITNDTSDLAIYLRHGENGYFVNEPTEECIFQFLEETICSLTSEELLRLKENAVAQSRQLDYRVFVTAMDNFTMRLS